MLYGKIGLLLKFPLETLPTIWFMEKNLSYHRTFSSHRFTLLNLVLKLEEERERSRNKLYHHQQLIKRWFDNKSSTIHDFDIGDLVLKWDKPHKDKRDYTKFQGMWLGLFIVIEKLEPGTVHLQTLEGLTKTYPTNV